MRDAIVNYLHYGTAMGQAEAMAALPESGIRLKGQLLENLPGRCGGARDLAMLIQVYGPKRSRRIDTGQFRLDLARSLEHQRFFASLGCRGFSYRLEDDIGFCEPLQKRISLRVALMPAEELFYPPKVKQYLRRVNSNHYFCDGFPSIAFALGMKTPEAWFVFIMQSDLALRGPSYIREHFRGWRKVLFAGILGLAHEHVRMIYLCRAEDVLRACHRSFRPPKIVPPSWRAIYDQTAVDFQMKLIPLPESVDIQIFQRQPRVSTDVFHALAVTS